MIRNRNKVFGRITPIIIGFITLLLAFDGCERLDPVQKLMIKTRSVDQITYNSCTVSGEIIDFQSDGVTQHGFCYSQSKNPSTDDNVDQLGSNNNKGGFSSDLAGLSPGTIYYLKAFATDDNGTIYGEEVEFTTSAPTLPVLTTEQITSITETSASSGGNINSDGGASITQKGVCWSVSEDPSISDSKTTDGSGAGSFSSLISGLSCGTSYFVRAYATNSRGTAYGNQVLFSTNHCTAGLPVVSTSAVSSITETTVMSGGNVTDDGGAAVTAKGVCWSTSSNPTITDEYLNSGSGLGSYSSTITGLACNTMYYVRAYATNASGTSYGSQVDFTTNACSANLPTLSTSSVTELTESSAKSGGNISNDGGAAISSRGVCWSTSQNPTLSDEHTSDGTGTGVFTSFLSGLNSGEKYYVRAYASNASGTAYGNQEEFTTHTLALPTVSTSPVTSITETTAQSGGNVSDEGGASVSSKGVCWSTSENPTISDQFTNDGSGAGSFTSSINNLSCEITYYVRAYATSSAGTAYGAQESFTTGACPSVSPTVITTQITNVTGTSAQSGGEVTSDGGETVTARGICWSTSPAPDLTDSKTNNGDGLGVFTSDITGLDANMQYYVRAYATNSIGTSYGNELSFNTNTEQLTDYDGNVYQTVAIGDQTWMAENLKVTHYADGTAIPLVENTTAWHIMLISDKAYCWNNNNVSTGEIYGALYNWAAAMNGAGSADSNPSGIQGVCPAGWHLPSDSEWKQLEMFLLMSQSEADSDGWRGSDQGNKLKESGTEHWNSPNTGANNSSGFTALPGGNRFDYGAFFNVGSSALFWSTSEHDDSWAAWARSLSYNIAKVYRSNYNKNNGFSVRCVRDY